MPDQLDQLYEMIKADRRYTRRWLKVLTISAVVKYLVVILLVVYVLVVSGNNHDVLCTFKTDLGGRVADTQRFLREHPNGGGLPVGAIRNSLTNQIRTLDSLSDLNCGD